jgi:hypothetical protein
MSKSNVEENQQPIPEAALRDNDAVEMLRVWIAERRMHCSIKVGMYRETTNIPEEKAWGIILADTARHVAHALESGYAINPEEALRKIRDSFFEEIDAPTSKATGEFARRH